MSLGRLWNIVYEKEPLQFCFTDLRKKAATAKTWSWDVTWLFWREICGDLIFYRSGPGFVNPIRSDPLLLLLTPHGFLIVRHFVTVNVGCCCYGVDFFLFSWQFILSMVDKTLTPSPWTTLMDYHNGLPKWTTLKWTTPKNTISDYILTLHDLRGLQPPFWLIILNKNSR